MGGGSAGPANHRPAAGRPPALGSCPRRGPRRRRAHSQAPRRLPHAAAAARPLLQAPGRREQRGLAPPPNSLLGQRPQTRSYYCSRARSASPPHPTSRSHPSPPSAGRLIPARPAFAQKPSAPARLLGGRAGGQVIGTSSPSTEARAGRAAAPTPKAARRPLSLFLAGNCQPQPSQSPPGRPLRTGPLHLGGAPATPVPRPPPADRSPAAPPAPGAGASTSALG